MLTPKSAYLELVQLTQLYLLQNIPPQKKSVKQPIPKTEPVFSPKPPKVEQKKPEAPPPVMPIEPVKTISPPNFKEILDLLNKHCPKVKLIGHPNYIYLIFGEEPEHEKELLFKIAEALRKEGHLAEVIPSSKLTERDFAQDTHLLIGSKSTFGNSSLLKRHAKVGNAGQIFIGQAKALVIPSLSDLISHPATRRTLWNEILSKCS